MKIKLQRRYIKTEKNMRILFVFIYSVVTVHMKNIENFRENVECMYYNICNVPPVYNVNATVYALYHKIC